MLAWECVPDRVMESLHSSVSFCFAMTRTRVLCHTRPTQSPGLMFPVGSGMWDRSRGSDCTGGSCVFASFRGFILGPPLKLCFEGVFCV